MRIPSGQAQRGRGQNFPVKREAAQTQAISKATERNLRDRRRLTMAELRAMNKMRDPVLFELAHQFARAENGKVQH